MKYLGEKSLSSALHWFLAIAWYVVLIAVLMISFALLVGMFSDPVLEPAESAFDNFKYQLFHEMQKDPEAMEFFTSAPAIFKVLAMIFLTTAVTLMLIIIKKGQQIFNNFKKNLVFHESNVRILSKISKLLIVFSIMTFNFPSLLVSIILLILTDVFKNGTALQEEHDLTV